MRELSPPAALTMGQCCTRDASGVGADVVVPVAPSPSPLLDAADLSQALPRGVYSAALGPVVAGNAAVASQKPAKGAVAVRTKASRNEVTALPVDAGRSSQRAVGDSASTDASRSSQRAVGDVARTDAGRSSQRIVGDTNRADAIRSSQPRAVGDVARTDAIRSSQRAVGDAARTDASSISQRAVGEMARTDMGSSQRVGGTARTDSGSSQRGVGDTARTRELPAGREGGRGEREAPRSSAADQSRANGATRSGSGRGTAKEDPILFHDRSEVRGAIGVTKASGAAKAPAAPEEGENKDAIPEADHAEDAGAIEAEASKYYRPEKALASLAGYRSPATKGRGGSGGARRR